MLHSEIKKLLEITDRDDQIFIKIDSIENRYCINRKGLLFDNKYRKISYPYSSASGRLLYDIYVNNEKFTFSIHKLFLMAYSPMNTSLSNYANSLDVIIYDKSIKVPSLDNLNWLIPVDGVECVKYPGFYSVVGNPNIVVSKDYRFLNYKFGSIQKIYIPKDINRRYPSISNDINQDEKSDCSFVTRFIHRLIALAFIPLTYSKENMIVNHKDGNKLNYNVENLEWTSYKGNVVHAFRSDLRTDNIPIRAINIFSREERVFHSLQEASRRLNFHAWDISVSKKALKERSIVRTSPWIFLDLNEKLTISFEKLQEIVKDIKHSFFRITNKENGNVVYLRSYLTTVKFLHGLTSVEFLRKNTAINTSLEIGKYLVERITRNELPSEVKEEFNSNREGKGGKVQKPIRVTDLSNNTVITYDSTDEFATLVGAKRKTIQHGLHLNRGIWRNFRIEYL